MDNRDKRILLFSFQRILLKLSYLLFSSWQNWLHNETRFDWIIGPQDVVNLIERLGKVLPNSFTVNLGNSQYFKNKYDFEQSQHKIKILERLIVLCAGPVLLGRLMTKSNSFIYVGIDGFLISTLDQRRYEFEFLRKHGKKIVCILTGTDIRSPKKSLELSASINRSTFAEYQIWKDPTMALPRYEEEKEKYAKVIDDYADVVFSWQNDQISYLKKPVRNLPYLCQNSYFAKELSHKFENLTRIKVLHAPSDPIIKGTAVVRAVVEMLKSEGFDFDYTELTGTPNTTVINELESTHILINQLYSLAPGILTIEGLAHRCAVLTSADQRYENLGESSKEAWIRITPGTLYGELRNLLIRTELIKSCAEKGYNWALVNASEHGGGKILREMLNSYQR